MANYLLEGKKYHTIITYIVHIVGCHFGEKMFGQVDSSLWNIINYYGTHTKTPK